MKLKLSFLFAFIGLVSWSQSVTQTFNASGTFTVPVGVTSILVEAWGGGGAGGGASGAGLIAGRIGGGGGAYASKVLTVNEGEILNVVVASQTAGTSGADGNAGGNSTITGFETSILAAGGSGGTAGSTDGVNVFPGGDGGSVAASAGDVRFAGVNGIKGNRWIGTALFLPAGDGGAGANSGGAGGEGLRRLHFGNVSGNAGTAPGGGGGGAINSGLGLAQTGGAGGAGRVIITYNSPALKAAENNVSVNNTNKVLSINSSGANINQVFVYDISGNLIYNKDGVSDSKLNINNLKSNNQVLVVKVVLDNNKVEIKKVVY